MNNFTDEQRILVCVARRNLGSDERAELEGRLADADSALPRRYRSFEFDGGDHESS